MTVNELQEELIRTKEIILQSMTSTISTPTTSAMTDMLALQATMDYEQPDQSPYLSPFMSKKTEEVKEEMTEEKTEKTEMTEEGGEEVKGEVTEEVQSTSTMSAMEFFSTPVKSKSD